MQGTLGFDEEGAGDAEVHLTLDHTGNLMTRRNMYRRIAEANPGQLAVRAVSEWRQLMEAADLDKPGDDPSPVALRYFMQAWNVKYRFQDIGDDNHGELRTYAEAIDAILRGNAIGAADLLVQQTRAKMMVVRDGHWRAARWLQFLFVSSTMMDASAEDEDHAHQME